MPTKIEWTRGDDGTPGESWNPTRGCSRVSEGCRNCYAERQAARFAKPGQPYHGLAKVTAPRDHLDRVGGRRNGWTGEVRLIPEKLAEPLRWRKGRRVFVNSMSDLFHEKLTDEEIAAVFGVMAACPQHTFIVLTKRAERMRKWFGQIGELRGSDGTARPALPVMGCFMQASSRFHDEAAITAITAAYQTADERWPLPNVILGVSVEDQKTADERIPLLLATPAAVRAVSYEPALGPVSPPGDGPISSIMSWEWSDLEWLIVGGESGPGARPCDVEWPRSVVEQCRAAGTAVFVKQLGARPYVTTWTCPPLTDRQVDAHICEVGSEPDDITEPLDLAHPKGGDPSEWPADLRVREFPEIGAIR